MGRSRGGTTQAPYQKIRTLAAGGSEGILARAQSVLDATEFAYRAGSISLLEYLDAVRTFADITRSYVDAVLEGGMYWEDPRG